MSEEIRMTGDGEPVLDRRRFFGGATLAGLAAVGAELGVGSPARRVAASEGHRPRPDPPAGAADGPYLDVRTFGARGDGKTDDTPALRKAVARVAATGGKLVFPAGRFLVTAPVEADFGGRGVWLAGAGQGVTFLVTRQPDASIFALAGNILTLSDLTLMGSPAARSGALLTTHCATENLCRCLFSTYHDGIRALGNVAMIRDCSWQGPQSGGSNGLIVDGYAGGMTVDGAVMYVPGIDPHSGIRIKPQSGIQVLHCGALQIADSNIMLQNHDLLIVPPKGRGAFSINAINTFFDTATTGINISPRGGVVARCSFTQCWASSHSENGIYIGGTGLIDGIQLVAPQVNFCGENGISINAPAKNIMIEGGEGVHNKKAAIHIGDKVTGVMVNHFFGGAGFGGSGPGYGNDFGIVIGRNCDAYQIANCQLLGNRSGAIRDGSSATAAKRIVANNMV